MRQGVDAPKVVDNSFIDKPAMLNIITEALSSAEVFLSADRWGRRWL